MLLKQFYLFADHIETDYLSVHHQAVNDKQNKLLRSGVLVNSLLQMLRIPSDKDKVFSIISLENSTGYLSLATAVHLLDNGVKNIHIDLLSSSISDSLTKLSSKVSELFTNQGGSLHVTITVADPICNYHEFTPQYDLALIDPPLGRYPDKNHPYPEIIGKLYSGNAYLYCAYMAVSVELLKQNGQLLCITPRTYTSGDYSIGFRKYLFSKASLQTLKLVYEHINLNHQTLLSSLIKCDLQQPDLTIQQYSIEKCKFISDCTFPSEDIIQSNSLDMAVYLPLTQKDLDTIKEVESYPKTFEEAGYQISTGPIIASQFKHGVIAAGCKSFNKDIGPVPLINLHNIRTLTTHWSGKHEKDKCVDPTNSKMASKLIANQPYIFLRRINAGFRTHKLTASVYNAYGSFKYLTVENHINYISKKNGSLNNDEAKMIADYLNSVKCRTYFSCTSGSSQFNAKKLRKLKLPNF
jgi:adenine-specific DNA-methyltransferase